MSSSHEASGGGNAPRPPRVTAPAVRARKGREPIVALTAYDVISARLVDEADIDVVLVGDSLGPNVLGYDSTLPVTLDEILAATRAVVRGTRRALVVADLPFGSYQAGAEDAVRASVRAVKDGGAAAVKLEGGRERAAAIAAVVEAGVPVMAHLGLLPQSVHRMGGYRVQGRSGEDAERLLEDARAVERAGAFAVVLEGIPRALAERITKECALPTIGIGAGSACDGQILVFTDLLGLTRGHVPKFVRKYAELGDAAAQAIARYRADVQARAFPAEAESYD